jgi:hypothetical protein
MFGVDIEEENDVVFNVKKYKNCVCFRLDSERTII